MKERDLKRHWNTIYQRKSSAELSWYQETPKASLDFIEQFDLNKTARIIDVGGGDSLFVDHLLERGFSNISVLDISEKAIERAQQRLGKLAMQVDWILADATEFQPRVQYDFWHDRAAFHFLTREEDIDCYLNIINRGVHPEGYLIVGTFSDRGPDKCSGLEIKKYSENMLSKKLNPNFSKIKCIHEDHTTPTQTVQNFIYCSFQKK
jgi:ubiquinone/menaquinone biosynthesis C-methylase UbiE